MKLEYKNLEARDISSLTPIMKAAFDEDTRIHTDLSEGGPRGYDTGELLEKLLKDGNSISKVILCDGCIVGEYTIRKGEDAYTLDLLFIAPSHASKGIGAAVWENIEQENQEAMRWYVETPAYSVRNRRFYEKCGFKIIRENTYEDGEKSVVFIKHRRRLPVSVLEYREDRDYDNILLSCKKEKWEKFYGSKKEQYKQALKESVTYAAYEGESYCGYIRCITDGVFTTYCCEIIVDDGYKRRGIGKMLIDKVKQLYPSCRIDVLSDNDEFYQANGFFLLCNGMRKSESKPAEA